MLATRKWYSKRCHCQYYDAQYSTICIFAKGYCEFSFHRDYDSDAPAAVEEQEKAEKGKVKSDPVPAATQEQEDDNGGELGEGDGGDEAPAEVKPETTRVALARVLSHGPNRERKR
jgi:hypothetical protein